MVATDTLNQSLVLNWGVFVKTKYYVALTRMAYLHTQGDPLPGGISCDQQKADYSWPALTTGTVPVALVPLAQYQAKRLLAIFKRWGVDFLLFSRNKARLKASLHQAPGNSGAIFFSCTCVSEFLVLNRELKAELTEYLQEFPLKDKKELIRQVNFLSS